MGICPSRLASRSHPVWYGVDPAALRACADAGIEDRERLRSAFVPRVGAGMVATAAARARRTSSRSHSSPYGWSPHHRNSLEEKILARQLELQRHRESGSFLSLLEFFRILPRTRRQYVQAVTAVLLYARFHAHPIRKPGRHRSLHDQVL